VEITKRRFSLSLAMMVLLAGAQALAQQRLPVEGLSGGYLQAQGPGAGPNGSVQTYPPGQNPFAEEQLVTPTDQSLWTESDSGQPYDAGPTISQCTEDCDGYCCPPSAYWEQNVRVLTRARARRTLITSDSFGQTLLGTRSMSFDIAAGYHCTAGFYLGRDTENRDHFAEFTYWGANTWLATRTANATATLTDSFTFPDPVTFGNLFSPFDSSIGGFNRVDEHFISYRSDIHNFELNARIRPRGRPDRLVLYSNGRWRRERQNGQFMSFLFGLRGASIDEKFGFFGRGTIIDGAVSNNVSGDYVIRSHNDMFGVQVGADLMFQGRLGSWGCRAKAAPMINYCDQSSRLVTNAAGGDPYAPVDLDERRIAKKHDIALLGEVGIAGTYKIRPHMILHASYDFIWVTGVAMAPEQLDFGSTPTLRLNDNGHLFYHGLSVGLECTW